MAGPRTVEEISGGKRIIREYDAAGQLVRILVLPVKLGEDADLPPVTRERRPSSSSAARALFWRRERKPAAPAPAAEAARAPPSPPVAEPTPPPAPSPPPPAPPVHVRFSDEPEPARGVDVVVEALAPPRVEPPILVESPADEPASEPEPAPFDLREPERVPEPEPEPVPPVVFVDAPEAEPAPAPEPQAARRRLATFEIIAIESLPRAEAAPEPEPIVTAPEPQPAPPTELEPDTVGQLAEPEPEPAPPAPPPSYVTLVPDVDARVDALLSRTDVRAKRRKRAPIPAPVFAPLAREPWEERLDAALGRSA